MPQPRKLQRQRAGSISFRAHLKLWEARLTVKLERAGDAERVVTPGSFTDFVDTIVPLLQWRGLVQRGYPGETFRERLEPP